MTPELEKAISRVRADHQAILGKPSEGPLEILWEAIQREAANDQVVALEGLAVDGLTTLLAALLPELFAPNAPFVPKEMAILNWLLHRAILAGQVAAREAAVKRAADALKID